MNKDSLKRVSDRIHLLVNDPEIPIYDKIEILINVFHFLNPDEYEENLKILQDYKLKLKKDK